MGPYTYAITVYSALALPAPDPVTLPSTGYTGVAYSGTINGSGGSGAYSWTVTGLSDNLSPSSERRNPYHRRNARGNARHCDLQR